MNAEIVEVEQQQSAVAVQNKSSQMLDIIARAASDPSVDIDKLERLMKLQQEMEERYAKTQFQLDFSKMQSEIPTIAKRGIGRGEKFAFQYATFEDINDIVKPIMQKYGFAIFFKIEADDAKGMLEVEAIVTHKLGHRESSKFPLPQDIGSRMNSAQAFGSATSYAKRYALAALLNISTRSEDDDGVAAAPIAYVSEMQARQIQNLLSKLPEDRQEDFNNKWGSAEQLPRARFNKTLAFLEQEIGAK